MYLIFDKTCMALSEDGTPSSTMVLTMVLSSPVTAAKQQDSSLMPLELYASGAAGNGDGAEWEGVNAVCPWRPKTNIVCGTMVRA